jgi:hypothetical protein
MSKNNTQLDPKVIRYGFNDQLTLERLINDRYIIVMTHSMSFHLQKKLENKTSEFKGFTYTAITSEDWDDLTPEDKRKSFREVIEAKERMVNPEIEMNTLFDLILRKLETEKNENNLELSLYEVTEKYALLFDKEKRTLKDEELLGEAGEYMAILKLENNNLNAAEWYHSNDLMKYDLYVKDENKYIEIKTTLSNNNIVHVKNHQIADDEEYTLLIKVTLVKDDTGENIVDIMQQLLPFAESNSMFLEHLQDKIDSYKQFPNILNQRFKTSNTRFDVFKCSDLPKIEATNLERISNVTYDINCIGINKYSIDDVAKLLH